MVGSLEEKPVNRKLSRAEAKALAKKSHVIVCRFLGRPAVYDILTALMEDSAELDLLKVMVKSKAPFEVRAEEVDLGTDTVAKSTVSTAAQRLDIILGEFANQFRLLRDRGVAISIPRKRGGMQIGYYFACVSKKDDKLLRPEITAELLENAYKCWEKEGNARGVFLAERHLQDAVVGNPPSPPEFFIGRDKDIDHLKVHFGVSNSGAKANKMMIVHGWPGIGKSTLGAAIANDRDIINHFQDGILWVSLGEKPDLVSEQLKWIRLLSDEQYLYSQDISHTSDLLRKHLAQRKALLVIDDVWETAHAVAFKVAGESCGTVYTTRLPYVAQSLARDQRSVYQLGPLSEEESLLLLSRHAKKVVDVYPRLCRDLVRELEGLPLAIRVAGRLLASELKYNWGVEQLLSELRDDADIIVNAEAPSDMADVSKDTTPKVAALLKKSTDKLDGEMRGYFAMLGSFAPRPAVFDLDAMAYVWQIDDPKPIVRELVLRGLLEPVESSKFQMHALLVTHAKCLLRVNDD